MSIEIKYREWTIEIFRHHEKEGLWFTVASKPYSNGVATIKPFGRFVIGTHEEVKNMMTSLIDEVVGEEK